MEQDLIQILIQLLEAKIIPPNHLISIPCLNNSVTPQLLAWLHIRMRLPLCLRPTRVLPSSNSFTSLLSHCQLLKDRPRHPRASLTSLESESSSTSSLKTFQAWLHVFASAGDAGSSPLLHSRRLFIGVWIEQYIITQYVPGLASRLRIALAPASLRWRLNRAVRHQSMRSRLGFATSYCTRFSWRSQIITSIALQWRRSCTNKKQRKHVFVTKTSTYEDSKRSDPEPKYRSPTVNRHLLTKLWEIY